MTTSASALRLNKPRKERAESPFLIILRRFVRHRLALISTFAVTIIFMASLLAPVITIFPRDAVDISAPSRPGLPGAVGSDGQVHWLGIDQLGRDLFTRVLFAGRISLSIALGVVLLSEIVGIIVGALAGFYGGLMDAFISRLIEFMLSIPLLPILLIVSAIMLRYDAQLPLPGFIISAMTAILLSSEREANQVLVLVMILVAFSWLGAARLMRGMALTLSKQDFVEALRAQGASDARIIFHHIIPNGLAPILVNASLSIGAIIITESSLSFLGLGVQDPTPTWGNMLAQSKSYMFEHPWLPLVAGIPLVLVSICFNFIGDGLRDALDPRLKR